MTTKDTLGDRIKNDYENRTRYMLPRRTYTIIRVDGKSFHTYTRNCTRPYDINLMADMDATAAGLCAELGGALIAFVQSDEISVLLTDFENEQTEAWFDGNLQKMASISSSVATAYFNEARRSRGHEGMAFFDSRVFTVPDPIEVENYFIWRQQDASRNSISMTAQAHFPHERLQGIGTNQLQEMLFTEAGVNWNDQPAGFKRGRCVVRAAVSQDKVFFDKRTGHEEIARGIVRHEWQVVAPPIFTQDREWLRSRIPRIAHQ